jgi:hypothetical protein
MEKSERNIKEKTNKTIKERGRKVMENEKERKRSTKIIKQRTLRTHRGKMEMQCNQNNC